MAKAKKVDANVQTWKIKKWVQIVSDKIFEKAVLGETPINDAKEAIGRIISVNMMTLTGDMKKQHISLTYKITDSRDNKLIATPIGYEISPSYIKRVVRKGKDRIDFSFLAKTKDEKVVVVKCVMIPRAIVHQSVRSLLKRVLAYETNEMASKGDFYQLLYDTTSFRFHNRVKAMLNRVYPLKNLEVRYLKIDDKIDPATVKNLPFKGLRGLQEKLKKSREEAMMRKQRAMERTTSQDEQSGEDTGSEEQQTSEQ